VLESENTLQALCDWLGETVLSSVPAADAWCEARSRAQASPLQLEEETA